MQQPLVAPQLITRKCGDCEACCYVAEIQEGDFYKPACKRCPFLDHGCSVYNTPKKPQVCTDFNCSWLRGAGSESDRPDLSHVMLMVNKVDGSDWIFAMDLAKNAHLTTGKNIIVDMINKNHLPAIIVDYDKLEKGKGDYVVIHDSMLARSSQLIGDYIGDLTDNMKIYKLIIH